MNFEISPEILNLKPYVPGKNLDEAKREYGLDKFVKLASNESPFPPSGLMTKMVTDQLKEVHRYPDPTCYELRNEASLYYGVAHERLTFGNGSNELIDLIIRAFCAPGDSILMSEGSFFAYKVCAQAARVKVEETPMVDGQISLTAMSEHLEKSWNRPKVVFIPNPNNPTGTHINKEEVTEFIKRWNNEPNLILVFDEAYSEFVRAEDFKHGICKLESSNIIVLKTLSKVFGIAGIRLGTIMADPEIIQVIDRIRNPFNVNSLAQAAGIALFRDKDYLTKIKTSIWNGIDQFYQALDEIGLPYYPSQTNFVLFNTKQDALTVNDTLLKKGLILRPVVNYGMPHHLRMNVGLPEENEFAIKTLKEVFSS